MLHPFACNNFRAHSALRKGVSAALTALIAAALTTHPRAAAQDPLAAQGLTGPTPPAAALMVGGTTFPTMGETLMNQMWAPWNSNLGLPESASPSLVNVAYPAELAPFTGTDPLGVSIAAGVSSLLAQIAVLGVTGGQLIVWGISQGALVLNAAQRILASDPSAPPAGSLTFVRVADPATEVTGMLNHLPRAVLSDLLRCDASLCAAVEESSYDTIVVVNEYDAFADFPNDPQNLLAVANALAGLFYRHGQTATVDLTGVPPQNISTRVNSLGATTTTYLVPSPFLPLTQPLRDLGVSPEFVDVIDERIRPVIDAGYTRDRAVSAADTAPATSTIDTTADTAVSEVVPVSAVVTPPDDAPASPRRQGATPAGVRSPFTASPAPSSAGVSPRGVSVPESRDPGSRSGRAAGRR